MEPHPQKNQAGQHKLIDQQNLSSCGCLYTIPWGSKSTPTWRCFRGLGTSIPCYVHETRGLCTYYFILKSSWSPSKTMQIIAFEKLRKQKTALNMNLIIVILIIMIVKWSTIMSRRLFQNGICLALSKPSMQDSKQLNKNSGRGSYTYSFLGNVCCFRLHVSFWALE